MHDDGAVDKGELDKAARWQEDALTWSDESASAGKASMLESEVYALNSFVQIIFQNAMNSNKHR